MSTFLRFCDRFVEQCGKIICVRIRAKHNVAAPPAIPAIWSALRHKFLAAKTDAAAAAVTGLRKNFDSINKHGWRDGLCPVLL